MIEKHEADIPILMNAIQKAIARPSSSLIPTIVVFITSGRYAYTDFHADSCIWRFNRKLVHEAHKHGFAVLEREEIERRFLFRHHVKAMMHLDAPGPQIVGTSLLALLGCLRRNGTAPRVNDIF
jgi:hypothetical protein